MRLVNLEPYQALLSRYRYWVMGIVILSPVAVLAIGFFSNPSYLASRTVTWVEGVPAVSLNKFWEEAQVQVEADKMVLALPALRKDSQKYYHDHYADSKMLPTQLILEHTRQSPRVSVRFFDANPDRAKAMADVVAEQMLRYVTKAETYQRAKVLDTLESHIRLTQKHVDTLDQKLCQKPIAPVPAAKPSEPPTSPVTTGWAQILAYADEQSRVTALGEAEQPLISELQFKRPQDASLWAEALAHPGILKQVEAYRHATHFQEVNVSDKTASSRAEAKALKLEQSLNGQLSKLWPRTNAAARQQMLQTLAGLTDRQMLMLRILAEIHQQYAQSWYRLAMLPKPAIPMPVASAKVSKVHINAPGDGVSSQPVNELLKQRDKLKRQQVFYEAQYQMLKLYLANLQPHVVSRDKAVLVLSSSHLLMLLVALVSMPASGFLMLVLLNFWSRRPQKQPGDIGTLLNQPVLQRIPLDKMVQHRSRQKNSNMVGLKPSAIPLVLELPPGETRTAVEHLAGMIRDAAAMGSKVFSIISPRPKSGTTFLVTNIATVLARSGLKTLIIDGNLKTPEVHEVFQLPESPGLVELLEGTANIKQVLSHVERFGPLLVMPAGRIPVDPVQTITHPQMPEVMQSLQKYFDVILFNTPSDIHAPETLALARLTGQTILNLKASDANPKAIRKWQRIFEEIPGRKLGVVINFSTSG